MRSDTRDSDTASDSLGVIDALARYYAAHGLPADGGASDPWFRVHIGPVTLRLPNPPARRRAVLYHDINHLATGYNTQFGDGEVSIAAFEVAAGCGRFGIVWYINLTMFAIGLLLRPIAVFRAFVRGRHSASIYRDPRAEARIATLTVNDVRSLLGVGDVPRDASIADRVAFAAWGVVAVAVLLAPLAVLAMAIWALLALAR